MARYGQRDDFHDQPTQHAIYSVDQDPLSDALPTAAPATETLPEPLEPETEPTAWYRKPAVLIGWAVLVLTLIALIGYGISELIRGGQGTGHTPGPTTSTPPTTTTAPAASTSTSPTSSAAGPPAPQPTHQPARRPAPQQPPSPQHSPEPQQSAEPQLPPHRYHPPHLPSDLPLPTDLPHLPSVITIPQIPTVITLPPGLP